MIENLDVYCFRGLYPFYNTFSKMQIQSSKNVSCLKKLQLNNPKLALSYNNIAELFKKNNKKD